MEEQSSQHHVATDVLASLAEKRGQFLDFLARRTREPADAEDILQQGFLRATRKVATLRDAALADAWFYRILRRLLADTWARESQQRQTVIPIEARPASAPPDVVTCTCSVHLMDTLPPQYADILRRVDLQGEGVAQIADALCTTPGNVIVRLHRARKALRQRLLEVCDTRSLAACAHCNCDGGHIASQRRGEVGLHSGDAAMPGPPGRQVNTNQLDHQLIRA